MCRVIILTGNYDIPSSLRCEVLLASYMAE